MSEVATITLPSDAGVVQIKQHCDSVFVALTNGTLLLYRRGNQSHEPDVIVLGTNEPVSCILPINLSLYVACGKNVHRLNAIKGEIQVPEKVKFERTYFEDPFFANYSLFVLRARARLYFRKHTQFNTTMWVEV